MGSEQLYVGRVVFSSGVNKKKKPKSRPGKALPKIGSTETELVALGIMKVNKPEKNG